MSAWWKWMTRRTILGMPLLAAAGRGRAAGRPGPPQRLLCERLDAPLAVETLAPRLSWQVRDPRRGARQTAYQILVASSAGKLKVGAADLWDSGKVSSDETLDIEYRGKPLSSGQRCYWCVRFWDAQNAPSPFSETAEWGMGYLKEEEWKAKWIGDRESPPPDSPPHLGYCSNLEATAEGPKWVAIDLGRDCGINGVRLYGTRIVGQGIGDVPGYLYPLRYRVEAASKSDFSDAKTVVRRESADIPNPGVQPVMHRFPPITARFVRLWVSALRQDEKGRRAFALSELEVLHEEENLARGAKVVALDSEESNYWSASKLTDGDIYWHHGGPTVPMTPPMLRKEFSLSAAPRRAMVYVSALGLYELRINGRRVGDQELPPEWTEYSRLVQYQAYDVTNLLRAGTNAIGVQLADGWYAGRVGMTQAHGPMRVRGVYGRKPRCLMQLQADLGDGSPRIIVSDESWKSTLNGPLRSADLYDGESYDARREMPGWDQPGFDDSGWRAVEVDDGIQARLRAQPNEPIRILHEIKPEAVRRQEDRQYVFDLGQNMVGRVRIRVRGKAGAVIRIRHAEALAPDGSLYTAMLRGAFQTDAYTLRGDPKGEVFEPRFTQHGFRYVEVNNLDYAPALDDLRGRVFYSSVPQAGSFRSSSSLVNKIWDAIMWTQRGNHIGVVTDCPQRDERLGWLGSIQPFAHTACFNMNLSALLRKVARDFREAQGKDGRFPNLAPNVLQFDRGAPAWADAGVLVPWAGYVHFGDRRLLEENYEAARRFIEGIRAQSPGLIPKDRGFNDWLNGDRVQLDGYPTKGAAIPQDLFTTAFFAHSTLTLAKMAKALGHDDDARGYEALAASIRQAFQRNYVDRAGKLAGDTQGSYALALHFRLAPEELRAQAVRHMLRKLEDYGNRFSTGIITTHKMLLALSANGENETAYRLFEGRECPSWGYMIEHGATTIWERWDGFVAGRQFSGVTDARGTDKLQLPLETGFHTNTMNSFNHQEFGAVGEWMYRVILGIEPDETAPGYKHFHVRPRPGGSLTYARGSLASVRGLIEVAWRRAGGTFSLDLTVPPNTSATVSVPADRPEDVTEGKAPAGKAEGVKFLRMEGGSAIYLAQAGSYTFLARRRHAIGGGER
jgi:alpha-L-rhamnosidase